MVAVCRGVLGYDAQDGWIYRCLGQSTSADTHDTGIIESYVIESAVS